MEPVYLRALELDDLERMHRWLHNREAYRTSIAPYRYASSTATEAWLRERSTGYSGDINLAICLVSTGEHIGMIDLTNTHGIARHAEMDLLIGEALDAAEEHARSAVRLLTTYAMRDLGLLRTFSYVAANNAAGIRTFEACGWTAEVRMRDHAFIEGEFQDVVIMGLCADDLSFEAHDRLFRTIQQEDSIRTTQGRSR